MKLLGPRVAHNPYKRFTEAGYLGDWSVTPSHVIIHGAGASGLMLGTLLKARGFSNFIVTSHGEPGGLIRTTKTEFGLREWAANGFLSNGRGMSEILRAVNLRGLPSNKEASAKFVVRNGQQGAIFENPSGYRTLYRKQNAP